MNGREAVFQGSVLGNPSSRYALSRYAPYAPPRHHTRAGPPRDRHCRAVAAAGRGEVRKRGEGSWGGGGWGKGGGRERLRRGGGGEEGRKRGVFLFAPPSAPVSPSAPLPLSHVALSRYAPPFAPARGERLARRAARTGRERRVREESSVEGGAGGETGANGGAYREIAAQRAAGRHRGLPCTSSFSINVDLQFCTEGLIKIYPECCSRCGPS
jgi:hypothetical protein